MILLPLAISLAANYMTWVRTKENIEITLKLESWIMIGTILDSDLENLELTYKKKPLKNIAKIKWSIINTGSKGISKFENPPVITYPKDINIAEVRISDKSPLLQVSNDLTLNAKLRTIEINDLGIFNSEDFIEIDVYIIDMPESVIPLDFL